MILVAKNKPEGGWICVVPECRYEQDGYHDLITHLRTEHHVLETHRDDVTMEVFDITHLRVEMMREGGAI